MHSIRRWLYKPKKGDKSLLAQFYYADEELSAVTAELDSLDGKKDPEKCTILVAQLRQCQDKVLNIITEMMDYVIPNDRAPRDFRVKYPDDVLQDNLAGQLWFGAECLAAGSNILNREAESSSMRPLAKAVVRNLDKIRSYLHEQCLSSYPEYTEKTRETFKIFDRLLADFEFTYVSAMVPVKTAQEYAILQDVTVLFSETLQRALKVGLLNQDQVDTCDPALMFTVPRLAILAGLIFFPSGPLQLDGPPQNMSELFRPFRNLLRKIRKLLLTLTVEELCALEKVLCSMEEPKEIPIKNGEEPKEQPKRHLQISATDMGLAAYCAAVPDNYFQNFFASHPECRALLAPPNRLNIGPTVCDSEKLAPPEKTTMNPAPGLEYKREPQKEENVTKESEASTSDSDVDEDGAGSSSSISGGSDSADDEDDTASSSVSDGSAGGGQHQRRAPNIVSRIRDNLDEVVEPDERRNGSVVSRLPTISCSCAVGEASAEVNVTSEVSSDSGPAVISRGKSSDGARRSEGHSRSSRHRQHPHESVSGPSVTSGRGRARFVGDSFPVSSGSNTVPSEPSTSAAVVPVVQSSTPSVASPSLSGLPSVTAACADDEAIALALQACELADREQIRSRFRDSKDLIHRLFVCISGIADQLQTNFAGDLRSILKAVFLMNATPTVESTDSSSVDSAEDALDSARLAEDECVARSYSEDDPFHDHGLHPDGLWNVDGAAGGPSTSPTLVASQEDENRSESPIRPKSVRQNVIHYLHPQVSHTIGSDIPYYPPDRSAAPSTSSAVPLNPSAAVAVMESTLRSPLASAGTSPTPHVPIDSYNLPSSPLSSSYNSNNLNGSNSVTKGPNWVPDSSAPDCMGCQAPFTVVRRRHHCRSCGKVFCSKCSRNSVPLPQFGHKKPVRVCNRCFVYQVNPFTLQEVL